MSRHQWRAFDCDQLLACSLSFSSSIVIRNYEGNFFFLIPMITAGFLMNLVRAVEWVAALTDHQILNLGIEADIILRRFFTDLVIIVHTQH